jgi:ubiquitin carboxyl-terminal hydrolase 36/42
LSEKAYILFFSRTKQRPVSAKTATVTNGTKFCNSNGPKTNPVNSVSLTPPTPRVDKITISPKKVKLGSFGVPKKPPANGNIKIVVHRKDFGETNGDVKSSNGHTNGACKTKPTDTVDSEKSQLTVNGNGKSGVANVKSLEDNGSRDMMPSETNPKFQNGDIKCLAGNFDSKRKIREEDCCILLAEDAQSRAKVDKLKENLRKEALLVLQSCGWLDTVYTFMRAKKKLCLREAENKDSNINELKSSLVAEAKPTFISRVPESLKSSLIKHLQEFSQEKKIHGPT